MYPDQPQGYPPPQYQYPQQPVVVVQQAPSPPPPTNAAIAWISCLCFFWPVGLVAVLKANEANKCIGRGDFEGARRNGEAAKKWAIAAIISGIALSVIITIIYIVHIAVFVSKVSYDWNNINTNS